MRNSRNELAKGMADLATESILFEVILTPKPGLVDAKDAGSHKDMDIFTFVRSAVSISHGFQEFFYAGYDHMDSPDELFSKIRPLGMEVEEKMYGATNSVNTHKGIIFSMGIVLAAIGHYEKDRTLQGEYTTRDTDEIFDLVRVMTQGLVMKDFMDLMDRSPRTHGERLYIQHGFTGIRGEAEAGYPILKEKALPLLREMKDTNLTLEEKLLETLVLLMAYAEDTNVVTRGGIDALYHVQETAKAFLTSGGVRQAHYREILEEMNLDFKEKNLSPGGAADLLSLAIFFGKLEGLLK